MGAIISRWKPKLTTVEQLENIDKEIKQLEEFRAKNQRLQKLWVGRLLLYSSALYLLISLVVYLLYLPEQWLLRLAMALPFFIYPVLVWFIRRFLIFLFSKRSERNNDKLEDLKATKKKILEEVMETETYKNAKAILERFDPDAKKKPELEATPVRPQMTPGAGQERVPLSAPGGPPERSGLAASVQMTPRSLGSPVPGVGMHPPGPPLARPVLPKDRGAVDRVIEYLVGDGPQNRYALICQQCFSHNGMALKEEFEYLAFRCAYCYFLNPARKMRPQAPRLPEFNFEKRLRAESSTPGPAPHSATDTEESAPPSRVKAPAPWNLVHSFRIQQDPLNPQNCPLQSSDEKDLAEDEVEGEEQQLQQQEEEEEEKEKEDEDEGGSLEGEEEGAEQCLAASGEEESQQS
ncbi:endoplasmic reticulum junction formation protein lunapark-B isoform X4 [Takifugu flavidus]|uniref:endoplasmic reticulum junction formation protein lunapark-B isoform X4 n=1 Tax=Takifugu flavidus TaxID=433684 RepID=UPI002544937A|nr:endoplasmic reticulum junction formation protein lunapark-B isoform X4 [Takifugu flavidus]